MNAAPGFLVLSANTPWVFALADGLAANTPVTAMRFYDWANYFRLRPRWPEGSPSLRRVMRAMPPGYAGSLEAILRPLTAAIIDFERRALRRSTGTEPYVICPYPYAAPWVRSVPDDRLIYYSLDEYKFYNPSRTQTTQTLEDELVSRARLVVCLSAHQCAVLSARHPTRADRIKHFPLGVLERFLNPDPTDAPEPATVGYVGNLTNRVDWSFVRAVAELCSDARFLFHGDLTQGGVGGSTCGWRTLRDDALSLPNVSYLGTLPQHEVAYYYWHYAINWMPYDMSNGFNIASCPTKIMDALASGRPFVSTDIPEVRLYDSRIRVVRTPEEAGLALQSILHGEQPHDARAQVEFAALNTWSLRARHLVELLEKTETPWTGWTSGGANGLLADFTSVRQDFRS